MHLLSSPDTFDKLFSSRTHHAPLEVGARNARSGSRIGGRAPDCMPVKQACPNCRGMMVYFLTLGEDVLAPAVPGGLALSVFYCSNFDCLAEHPGPARPSLTVEAHRDYPRAERATAADSPVEGRRLSLGRLTQDADEYGNPDQASKVGGSPGLIQLEDYYLRPLKRKGLDFLFQFNEESYPDSLGFDEYPLGYGAIYVFAKFRLDRRLIDPRALGVFIQNS